MGFTKLAHPVDGQLLAARELRLKAVLDELKASVAGPPYFPFTFYRPGEIRSSQSYLTKFPAGLLEVLPELAPARPAARTGAAVAPDSGRRSEPGGTGRVQDVRLRMAVERHAVELATAYYLDELGAQEVEELGKPFDLIVRGLGATRHVEVKGSTLAVNAVELTVNEVAHATHHQPTDLVVVDQILVHHADGESPVTSGGRLQIWKDWVPAAIDLSPTRYAYALPVTSV
ncbi:DUF3883 domain-containing protein [Pseudonocardia sp. S2-4]|uniref:DUF3883 domain-containing protein n=1 Tax=Pseudonocardia humida TaxID=2800819 RepID=A0ABT1A295_9PSEU|nr:DUF3883 domain-containing protein [Pseudonocardia humida]